MVRSIKTSPLNKFRKLLDLLFDVLKKWCARTFGPPQFAKPLRFVFLFKARFLTDSSTIVHHHGITTIWGRIFFLISTAFSKTGACQSQKHKCVFFFYISGRSTTHSIYLCMVYFPTLIPYKINQRHGWYGYYESLTPKQNLLADEFYWVRKKQGTTDSAIDVSDSFPTSHSKDLPPNCCCKSPCDPQKSRNYKQIPESQMSLMISKVVLGSKF